MADTDAHQEATRTGQVARANEARLRALIASAQDAVVIMDAQGLVVDWNPCAERMFGWSADEAIGARLSDLVVPPHLRAAHENGVRRYVNTRQGHIVGRSIELTAVSRSGHEIPIELSLWPLESEGDLFFGAFIHDIHSRKAAERALREQEEKYRQVVDNGSEGILVVREARIVFANPATERLLGVTLADMQSAPFTNWIHPEDRALVVDRHLRRLRGEPVDKQYAFRILNADGSVLWVELSAVPIVWEGEQATLSFITDITQRKELEQNLQRTLGELQHRTHEQEAILQSTLIGIGLIAKRRFQWCNRTLAEMFHYAPEALIGQPASMLLPDTADLQAFHEEVVASLDRRGSYEGEKQLRCARGLPVWVQLQGTLIDADNAARSSLWTFVDISKRKRAEEDMQRNLQREKELNQLKSRFVSMTSHEFRTPLAGILSSAELIRHYGDRLPPEELAELFGQVEDAVERMTRMLDNILLIGRADVQGLKFRPTRVDLEHLCRELAEEVTRPRTGGHERPTLRMEFHGSSGEHWLDPTLLRHVLGNLLSNAFKYSPSGGEVRFEVHRIDDWIHLEVADQGIGIPLEDQGKLFETFHRASNVGNISGTGLGLAIVKQSVDLHGGRISLDSVPGRGSCFKVDIPLGKEQASE